MVIARAPVLVAANEASSSKHDGCKEEKDNRCPGEAESVAADLRVDAVVTEDIAGLDELNAVAR